MTETQPYNPLNDIPWEKIRTFIDAHTKVLIPDEEVRQATRTFSLTRLQIAGMVQLQDRFCTRCGECCRTSNPIDFTKEELRAVAKRLGTSYKRLKRKLRARPRGDGAIMVPGKPCPFLEGRNHCTIYDLRPMVCRLYPLGKSAGEASISGAMGLPSNCPAVKDMILHMLLAQIVLNMARREGSLPETLPTEVMENILKKTGFSPTEDPLKQAVRQKLLREEKRCRRA